MTREARFVDRRLSLLMCAAALFLLFIPKINLIRVGGSGAGIRFDDLVMFGFAGIAFLAHVAQRKKIDVLEWGIAALFVSSLISFLINRLCFNIEWVNLKASPFYIVRMAEYFTFFYLGRAALGLDLPRVLKWYVAWQAVVMLLQAFGVIGAFGVSGYRSGASTRVFGMCSHPTELACLLAFLFCALAFRDIGERRGITLLTGRRRFVVPWFYLLFFLFFILVGMTGSRAASVALMVALLGRIHLDGAFKTVPRILGTVVLILVLVAVAGTVISGSKVRKRTAKLAKVENLYLVSTLWEEVDVKTQFSDAMEIKQSSDLAYDMSWWIRAHKWVYIAKSFLSRPWLWLFGLGPGVCGSALDGGWLRLVTENGCVGALVFVWLFACIARRDYRLKWMVIMLGLNMVFIDSYLSYKPITLLFFVAGVVAQGSVAGETKSKELVAA